MRTRATLAVLATTALLVSPTGAANASKGAKPQPTVTCWTNGQHSFPWDGVTEKIDNSLIYAGTECAGGSLAVLTVVNKTTWQKANDKCQSFVAVLDGREYRLIATSQPLSATGWNTPSTYWGCRLPSFT